MSQTKYHRKIFKAVHGQDLNHAISIQRMNADQIRHLACCFWTNAKHASMRDIQQKVLNLVMAPVNQKDARLQDAIQCGVEQRLDVAQGAGRRADRRPAAVRGHERAATVGHGDRRHAGMCVCSGR